MDSLTMRADPINLPDCLPQISCRLAGLIILFLSAACQDDAQQGNDVATQGIGLNDVETISLPMSSGAVYEAERGFLVVPENRSDPNSALIEVAYYRLISTSQNPATPIFVLPGGPGSSWTTQIKRASENHSAGKQQPFFEQHFFEDLRSVADVVVVDQRGAGLSRPRLTCADETALPGETPISSASYASAAQSFVANCLQELAESGRDIRGYSVLELVDDVDALRKALGYRKISLFAGSFGSQWSLSYIREYEGNVDRFVLWGIEGLDYAYDSPDGVLEALTSVYEDTAPVATEHDEHRISFADKIERTLHTLRNNPSSIGDNGNTLHFGAEELRRALYGSGNFSVRDRATVAAWRAYVSELLSGQYSRAMPAVQDAKSLNKPGDPIPQYLSIDCGLSVSAQRRTKLDAEQARAVLGNINYEYDVICPMWPAIDVGDEFRASQVSNLPGIFIHGTWDVSTPLVNAREVALLFPNVDLIVVEQGTHRVLRELYREAGGEIRTLIKDYLGGEAVQPPTRIELPKIHAAREGA